MKLARRKEAVMEKKAMAPSSYFSSSSSSSSSSSERKEDKEEPEEKVADDETPLFLSEIFGTMCAQDTWSDCTFVVGKGKERIPAHRLILAVNSPVFASMLYPAKEFPDQKLPEPFDVPLPSVDPANFRDMLRCIYADEVKVESSNIQPLINLAKRYQIEKLQVLCAEFLEGDVSVENACELFEIAPKMLDDKDFGLPFIREHTEDILETEGWLRLSKPRLISLLGDDELATDEFTLYKAVLKWAKASIRAIGGSETPDTLRVAMADFIPLVRFPTMQLDEIAGHIAPSGVLAQEQLLELFKFVSLSDEKEKEEAAIKLGFPTKARAGGGLSWKESKIMAKVCSEKKYAQAMVKIFGLKPGGGPKPKLTLLYRGSRDGFNAGAFHTRCDGKGANITIIKAQGRANIFGGFVPDNWSATGAYGTDRRSWLFSLVNSHGKPVRLEPTGSNMQYNASGYGPTWGGGHDLHVNTNMKSTSNYCSPNDFRTVKSGFDSVSVDANLLSGSSNFTVEEIEVFGVKDYKP